MTDRATTPTEKNKPRPQGMTPTEAREKISALFHAANTGRDFAAALVAEGFQLVKTT